jgi:hypothetical protein
VEYPNHDFRSAHMRLINQRYAEFRDYHQGNETLADIEFFINGVLNELSEELYFTTLHEGSHVNQIALRGSKNSPRIDFIA